MSFLFRRRKCEYYFLPGVCRFSTLVGTINNKFTKKRARTKREADDSLDLTNSPSQSAPVKQKRKFMKPQD